MKIKVKFLKAWSSDDAQFQIGDTTELGSEVAKTLAGLGIVEIVKAVDDDPASKILESLDRINDRIDQVETDLKEASKPTTSAPQLFNNDGQGVPGIRSGNESVLSSEPFMISRLARSLYLRDVKRSSDWEKYGKRERDLCQRLASAYGKTAYGSSAQFMLPLGASLMEIPEDVEGKSSQQLPGRELVTEVRQMFNEPQRYDGWEQYQRDAARMPFLRTGALGAMYKDLSSNSTITGGALVAFPAQGELIEVLRAMEFFSQVGATEITLPPQGSIRFPRQSGTFTIDAYAEAETATESDPASLFGELLLQAKKYVGLVDIPEELLMFSSVAVEAWLRSELARDHALKVSADSINGTGGKNIQGIINYSGVVTRTASTTATNGDTLDPEDPILLYGDIADQDAPVNSGFFYGMRNALWAQWLSTRVDQGSGAGTGAFAFAVAAAHAAGSRPVKTVNGETVVTSTQIPNNRDKGTSTDLTLLLAGVGPEWIIARGGVMEFAMTNSDASKFQQGLSTMRSVQFVDAGPRHEESFGYIDDLDITA